MGHLTSPYVAAFSISTLTPQAIKNQKGAILSGSLTSTLNLFSSLLPKSLYRCDNESMGLHLTLPPFQKIHHEAKSTSDSIRITLHPCTLVLTKKKKQRFQMSVLQFLVSQMYFYTCRSVPET